MTTINITNNIIHDPLEFLKLIPKLAEKYPETFLWYMKQVDPSLRYRIFMDYIKDSNDDFLEYLAVEIEVQMERRKKSIDK